MSENPNYQQNPGEFIPAPQLAPAYNMQGGYPGYQPTPSSALAIASLILGIVALVKVKKGTGGGKGMAIGGIVTGALGMIFAVVTLILGLIGLGMLSDCAENAVQDSSGNYVCTVHGETMTMSPKEYESVRR